MKRIILLILIALMATPMANALTYTENIETVNAYPSKNTSIGNFTLEESGSSHILDILAIGVPFDMYFSQNDFTISNTSTLIKANVSIPRGFAPNTYSGYIRIMSNTSNIDIPFNVTVPKVVKYEIINNGTIESDAYNGIEKYIANITIENSGNTDMYFDINVTDELEDILEFQSRIEVYKGMINTIDILSSIPKSMPFGTYEGNMTIKDEYGKKTIIGIEIEVVDKIRPEITYFSFDDVESTRTVTFSVRATDNIDISKVTAEILTKRNVTRTSGNHTYLDEITESYENITLEKDTDTNYYVFDYSTDDINQYYVNIIAKDESGNKAYNTTNFKVKELDTIDYEENIVFDPSKHPRNLIFTTDMDTPIKIILRELNYAGNWTLQIETPNGNKIPVNYVNESISVSSKGEYYITFAECDARSDIDGNSDIGVFNGKIELVPIEQHVDVNYIIFSGNVVDYETGKAFDEVINGNRMTGEIIDTGELKTSSYKVCTLYPIDTPFDKLSVCMTADAYNYNKNQTEKTISDLEEEIEHKNSIIVFSWFSILTALGISFFIVTIYPRVYILLK